MAEQLQVSFVTPHKQVSACEVDMVVAPSALGGIGILPGHETLLAELVPGVVELRYNDSRSESFAIAGGFIEVDRNHVALLVEAAERPAEIDVDRARAALAHAEKALKTLTPVDVEYDDHIAHAERARVRLQVAAMGSAR